MSGVQDVLTSNGACEEPARADEAQRHLHLASPASVCDEESRLMSAWMRAVYQHCCAVDSMVRAIGFNNRRFYYRQRAAEFARDVVAVARLELELHRSYHGCAPNTERKQTGPVDPQSTGATEQNLGETLYEVAYPEGSVQCRGGAEGSAGRLIDGQEYAVLNRCCPGRTTGLIDSRRPSEGRPRGDMDTQP
jgi:hypothetical protein